MVVIGGGIAGLASAWYLRKAGAEVTVVCRQPLPGGDASAGNAGMIVPSHVVPLSAPGAVSQGLRYLLRRNSPFHIKPRPDPDLLRWLWRFWRSATEEHVAHAAPVLRDHSMASLRLFEELQEELGDFSWKQTGLLMAYRTERYREENLRMADLAASLGLRVRSLDRKETLDRNPRLRPDTEGSVLYEDDGRVDPAALLARLREGLGRAGVTFRQDSDVVGLSSRSGGGAEALLAGGQVVSGDHLVLGAGAWTGQLVRGLGEWIPLQPAKGYSLTFQSEGVGPEIPVILSEEKITVTAWPGALRFAGTLSLAGFDLRVVRSRVDPILDEARRYLPKKASVRDGFRRVWVGFRPASPDGLPIVGPLPDHPEVLVATGHGMTGLTHGPVSGRLIADLLTGAKPVVDPEPVRPSRF